MAEMRLALLEDVLLCVGGSVASAWIPSLVQAMLERKITERVSVALSISATQFVSETALAILSGTPCVTDIFKHAKEGRAIHVELARRCQAAVVAPATANLVGKLANGIVDCNITTVLSVFSGPVLLAPAVHPVTHHKPSFQRNLAQLDSDGYAIIGPVEGYSVSERSRDLGRGAMAAPEEIASHLYGLAGVWAVASESGSTKAEE